MGGVQTLILNASFEPLHVVSWQRAITLLFQGKVEVVEESDAEIRTVRLTIKIPSVLRLIQYVPMKKKHTMVRFSRQNVLIRDDYTCQYCGDRLTRLHLTLDHVVPVVQGGTKCWENIVTSCMDCNQKKGGRTPIQAGMKLVRPPRAPNWLPSTTIQIGITVTPDQWKVYFHRSQSDDSDQ